MTTPHLRLVTLSAAGAILLVVLLWEILSLPPKQNGSVFLGFAGFTNQSTGATIARFTFSNGLSRYIEFRAGPVQLRQSEGWPHGSDYSWFLLAHLGPSYKVAPSMCQTFSVTLPNVEGAVWRVPVVYAKVGTKVDGWVDHVKLMLRRPVVGVAWPTNTPEMVGSSNQTVQRTGAQETNSTSPAAGSGR